METGERHSAFARLCQERHIPYCLLEQPETDSRSSSAQRILDEVRPWAVVHAAGSEWSDAADLESETLRRASARGLTRLADACE